LIREKEGTCSIKSYIKVVVVLGLAILLFFRRLGLVLFIPIGIAFIYFDLEKLFFFNYSLSSLLCTFGGDSCKDVLDLYLLYVIKIVDFFLSFPINVLILVICVYFKKI